MKNIVIAIFARLTVLLFITYDFFSHFNREAPYGLQFEGLRAALILYYAPVSVFLLAYIFFAGSRTFFIIGLCLDVLVLYFGDDVIRFMI